MKLRTTTTPASTLLTAKRVFIFIAVLVVALSGIAYLRTQPASADEYDAKIRTLQADMARYQKEADRLNGEATTLATALSQLTNEKNAIQAQVNLSQTQHDQLVIKISETEKEIKNNQDALGGTIADLYVDDDISPVEMLASSQNISDFLNKQEYRNTVKDQLSSTIKKVKDLKAQLSTQKAEVEKVLAQQKASRDALVAKEAEQANLLARTQNDESAYQGMIKDSQAQINEARATQAAIRARLNSTGGYASIGGSSGGYPWNAQNCPMVGYLSSGGANGSGGDGAGYGCRQCASYVAWRIGIETGHYGLRLGDAKDFTYGAQGSPLNGKYVSPSSTLDSNGGYIAVMDPAKAGQGFGHVAWVEQAYGDKVVVSQYNMDIGQGYGMYSKLEMSKYAFDHYVKVK